MPDLAIALHVSRYAYIQQVLPSFFFFNDTATTEIYTLSLHDALPIYLVISCRGTEEYFRALTELSNFSEIDRKSTRLNSSHTVISYAVFCLKKKTFIHHIAIFVCQRDIDHAACGARGFVDS